MKRSMVLILWMFAGAAANGWAQDAVWTNVVEGVVTTGSWHTAANWLPNAVPAAGQNVRLTNAVESYVVEVDDPVTIYATSSSEQTLSMSAPVGNTVTLDVNANITGGTGTDAASYAQRLTLDLGRRSIVNVAPGTTMRFNPPISASGVNLMYGTLEVSGTAYWHHRLASGNQGQGHHHPHITVRDGGELSILGQNSPQTDHLTLGSESHVVIEASGRLNFTGSTSGRGLRMSEVQGWTQQILVSGVMDVAATIFNIGSGNASTTTGPEVHVEDGGVLRFSGNGIYIARAGAAVGAFGKFFLNGGAVTNQGLLSVAHGRGANRDQNISGTLEISAGDWLQSGETVIGGYPTVSQFENTPYAGGWSYPPKINGSFTRSGDGYFMTATNVFIARGPAIGTMTLSGGDFVATNAAGNATLHVGALIPASDDPNQLLPGRARLNLYGGDLTVDGLIGTFGVAKTSSNAEGHSVINFHAGSLSMKASTLDLGIPLTVGDGTQTAVLNLLGGTHSSAFGYVIKPNATLAVGGSGAVATATVSGNVTFNESAKLQVELADADTADRINVTGSVVLAGELDVAGLGSYEPSGGEWTVLTASGGVTGAFSSVTEGYKAEVLGGDTLVVKSSRGGTMLLIR